MGMRGQFSLFALLSGFLPIPLMETIWYILLIPTYLLVLLLCLGTCKIGRKQKEANSLLLVVEIVSLIDITDLMVKYDPQGDATSLVNMQTCHPLCSGDFPWYYDTASSVLKKSSPLSSVSHQLQKCSETQKLKIQHHQEKRMLIMGRTTSRWIGYRN